MVLSKRGQQAALDALTALHTRMQDEIETVRGTLSTSPVLIATATVDRMLAALQEDAEAVRHDIAVVKENKAPTPQFRLGDFDQQKTLAPRVTWHEGGAAR